MLENKVKLFLGIVKGLEIAKGVPRVGGMFDVLFLSSNLAFILMLTTKPIVDAIFPSCLKLVELAGIAIPAVVAPDTNVARMKYSIASIIVFLQFFLQNTECAILRYEKKIPL